MPSTPTSRLKLPLPAETDPADVPADLLKLATALDSGGSGALGAGAAIDSQGVFSSRPAAATAGRYFYATDTGVLYRDTGTAWVALGPYGQTPLVTTLPASPVDAQEVYLQADATNGVIWELRYNAGSASAYKWEFIGGSPLYNEVTADDSIDSTTYGEIATHGPAIPLPRIGDYDVTIGANFYNLAAGTQQVYYSFALSGVAGAVDGDAIVASLTSAGGPGRGNYMRAKRKTFTTVQTVVAQYRVQSAAGGHVFDRWMSIRPIRLA